MTEEERALTEQKVASAEMFRGSILSLFVDQVELPNGKTDHREYLRHSGAVAIIPVTDDGRVVVERQFRYPIGGVLTEIPAGKLTGPDEPVLEAAKRELREETGYTADKWTDLGCFHPAAAYSDETITLFLAQGLHPGEPEPDDDEFIIVKTVPFSELLRDALAGRLPDAQTQIAVLRASVILQSKQTEGKL